MFFLIWIFIISVFLNHQREMQETDEALEEEEQRLGTALSSFMKALDVAEEKLSRVSCVA